MNDSRYLRVLGAAESLSHAIDHLAHQIDVHRVPGAKAQLCEAAASIAANIGEASNLDTNANRLRQLRVALASATETAVHLRRIRAQGALPKSALITCQSKHAVTTKMLTRLIDAIERAEAERRNDEPRRVSPP